MSPWKALANRKTKDNWSRWVYDSRSWENSQEALRAPEEGQGWNQAEKAPVLGVQAFIKDPGWSAVGSPGWAWMGPFKPEEQDSGELWGCHWRGACAVDPGFSKTAGLKEGGHVVQVLTGLAGVSLRTCRLPAPQTDAEAAPARSSQGGSQQSSVWSFLLEPSQCPSSFKMGEEIQHRNGGKYMNLWEFNASKELISTDAIPLCYRQFIVTLSFLQL